jgi:hypothetical protein
VDPNSGLGREKWPTTKKNAMKKKKEIDVLSGTVEPSPGA